MSRRLLLGLLALAASCSNPPDDPARDVGDGEPTDVARTDTAITDMALDDDDASPTDVFVPPEDCSATHASGLPDPGGPFCVGVTSVVATDSGRADTITGADEREVVMHFWYPTYTDTGDALRPVPDSIWQQLGVQDSADSFAANAIVDAPIARGADTFPTAIFMPGFTAAAGLWASWIEHLVSHGWVVVAVEHPGISTAVYPDGTVVDPLPRPATEAETTALLEGHFPAVLDDALFARGELSNAEAVPFATERLQTDSIVYFGDSYGGATAVAACEADATCIASINIDGRFFFGTPSVFDVPSKPWGIILSDGRFHDQQMPDDETLVQVWEGSTGERFYTEFAGAGHLGLSDILFYYEAAGQTPPDNPAIGSIHRLDVHVGATTVIATFLDKQLGRTDTTVADAVADLAFVRYGE